MTKERELLIQALEDWDFSDKFETLDPIFEDIRTYLSTSDDAEEPVGYQWLRSGHFRKQIPKNANAIEWYPLYLHPPKPAEPARKPMTEEEIDEEIATNEHYCERSFAEGVRYAEKHHGITDADL